MASQSELVIRKKRPKATVSPENFHVSLSNLVLGKDPVVPQHTASVEASGSADVTITDDTSDNNDVLSGRGSPALGHALSPTPSGASHAQCENTCRKQRNHIDCEKNKCLKKTATQTPESSAENTDDDPNSHGRKEQKRSKKSKAHSDSDSSRPGGSSTQTESSEQTNEVTANASVQAAGSSGAEAQTSAEESGWSLSEDHLLRGMKEDTRGPSWKEISGALNRSKKDVQVRWRAIKDQPHEEETGEDDEKTAAGTAKRGAGKTKNRDPSKWHRGQHSTRLATENKIARSLAASKPATPMVLSGEEPSSSSASSHDGLVSGPNDEHRRGIRYLRRHIYSDLYPPTLSPAPDAYFGPRDCEVLAAVESRYRRGKWLEMQANFYNVTGRMVPLDIIKEKCEKAEEEEEEEEAGAEERGGRTDGRNKVERWVTGVDQENLDDPEP